MDNRFNPMKRVEDAFIRQADDINYFFTAYLDSLIIFVC